MKCFLILIILISWDIVFAVDDKLSCNNWEQYKDEHCYKLFDGLVSYSDAEKICQTNNSSMVSIHYQDEQNFLNNFLFTKKKVVDNVWIGAKYVGNKLQWENRTPLAGGYSNWATGSPKNRTDYCVQMSGDPDSVGKWIDEPCAKKNLAICQRMKLPSFQLLAETVIELKHSLLRTTNQLAETKKELILTTNNLIKLEKIVAQQKQKNESIPIGFIYFQLPKDKAPTELWPNMTWKDISTDYEGVFFRVNGGDAASFGQVQQGNAPRLGTVHCSYDNKDSIKTSNTGPFNLTIPINGWSEGIVTGTSSGSAFYYMNFQLTDIAEVRPKNMAIKVYKRTA